MYTATLTEQANHVQGTKPTLYCSFTGDSLELFRGKRIVISYNGIVLKIRLENEHDRKTHKVGNKGSVAFSKVDDRHNWTGKFVLFQEGEWYILDRIETPEK